MPEKGRIENGCRSSEKREVDDEERDGFRLEESP